MITSNQNKMIKELRGLLSSSRKRKEAQRFVIEGVRLAEEALQEHWPLQVALYSETLNERGLALINHLADAGVAREECTPEILASLSDTQHSQGIMLLAAAHKLPEPTPLDFVLIFDEIQDPGNMGSLMRSAMAAGVQSLWLSPGCVDPTSPKVLRSAMGAHFRLPLREMDWPQIQIELEQHNLNCIVSDVNGGVDFRQADFQTPCALILGNEARGAGEKAQTLAQQRVNIPMQAATESINAAAAGAILLFEIAHQKGLV